MRPRHRAGTVARSRTGFKTAARGRGQLGRGGAGREEGRHGGGPGRGHGGRGRSGGHGARRLGGRARRAAPPRGAPAPGAAPAAAGAAALRLRWATTRYAVAADAQGPIQLTVLLENPGPGPTGSTSILWEPAAAEALAFAGSDPAPWRVRRDERGWGVLDTAGVLPGRIGTFRLWFSRPEAPAGGGPAPLPPLLLPPPLPRIVVVADGRWVVADTVADVRLAVPPAGAGQGPFERGALAGPAGLAERVPGVPAHPAGALPVAAGCAALLALVAGAGAGAAFRAAGAPGGSGGLPVRAARRPGRARTGRGTTTTESQPPGRRGGRRGGYQSATLRAERRGLVLRW